MDTDRKYQAQVLFVFPGFELGGAERQGLHLARYLKERNFRVSVWATIGNGKGPVVDICESESIPCEVHRFLWPCRKSSLLRDGYRFLSALRRIRPDVVLGYCNSPNVACGLIWRLSSVKAFIWGQRNVHQLHGDAIERYAYRHASAVICNAAHEVDHLQETLRQTRAGVHVVHNGVELKLAQRDRAEWRRELDIGENAVVAVMLANFRRQKDHPTLLRAWAQLMEKGGEELPNRHLVLAGAPQFTFEDVQSITAELGLQDSVRFAGQVSDVSGLLAACDVGVLISHHEGLSNAVLEYMGAGLPVVVTDLPGNREALGEVPEIVLCPAGDPECLAQDLTTLFQDRHLRAELGHQNRLRVIDQFSVESMCRATTEIILGLVNQDG